VGEHHTLGLARRPPGVENARKVVLVDVHAERRWLGVGDGLLVAVGQPDHVLEQGVERARLPVGQEHTCLRVGSRVLELRQSTPGVQGDDDVAGRGKSEIRLEVAVAVRRDDRDPVAALKTKAGQVACQPTTPGPQRVVIETIRAAHNRFLVRCREPRMLQRVSYGLHRAHPLVDSSQMDRCSNGPHQGPSLDSHSFFLSSSVVGRRSRWVIGGVASWRLPPCMARPTVSGRRWPPGSPVRSLCGLSACARRTTGPRCPPASPAWLPPRLPLR